MHKSELSIQKYWSALAADSNEHPEDVAILQHIQKRCNKPFCLDRPPGPMLGPLQTAKVVICYGNPFEDMSALPKQPRWWQDETSHQLARQQLTGNVSFPLELSPWAKWFLSRVRRLGLSEGEAAQSIAVLNLVPYASAALADSIAKVAMALPSVWAAQKCLREELLPRARAGEIFLIVARKHAWWGVNEATQTNNPNVRIQRNIGGHLGQNLAADVARWMKNNELTIY